MKSRSSRDARVKDIEMVKLAWNWCGLKGRKSQGQGDHFDRVPEPQIKRLEEIDSMYQIDWRLVFYIDRLTN